MASPLDQPGFSWRSCNFILTVKRSDDILPSPMGPLTYKLSDLCDLAGVTPRTVHFYIQQGLLPPATTLGPKATYDPSHLARLKLIRSLQREHLPLAVIRERLALLSDGEVELLLNEPPAARSSATSAVDYIQQVLRNAPGARTGGTLASKASAEPPLSNQQIMARLRSASATVDSRLVWDRSQWDRIAITADLELHVRRPLSREQNRKLERLIKAARQIFEEDQE